MISNEEIITYKNVARIAHNRAKKKSDAVIGITGYEGDGKSSLAILIGMACCKLAGLKFNLLKNELYSPKEREVFEKLTRLPKYSPIIADEAIKILYKLGWQKQIYINTLYALARKENKITLLCMPSFMDFNSFFRNHRINLWIHILARGHAIVFAKEWSPFSKDPWNIDFNQKLVAESTKKKKISEYDIEQKISILRKCRNYIGYLPFNKLSDTIEEKYEKLRDEFKYKGMENTDSIDVMGMRTKLWKTRACRAVKVLREVGFKAKDIGLLMGMHSTHVVDFRTNDSLPQEIHRIIQRKKIDLNQKAPKPLNKS